MNVLLRPVFLICCLLFIIHQVMQYVLHWQVPLLNNYLDNLLAMPILLTLLWAERRWIFKKGNQYRLPIFEGVVATIYIIFIGEWLFPLLSNRFTSDWWDVPLYILGSIGFYVFINDRNHQQKRSPVMGNGAASHHTR